MPPGVKQACDACRRRKIRCAGGNPCLQCNHASLSCTFLSPLRAKGRQGRTANIISELRAAQIRGNEGIDVQPPAMNRTSCPTSTMLQEHFRTPGLLSQETVNACSAFFLADFYSTLPILRQEMIQYNGDLAEAPNSTYCLIVSFCAFIIIQTRAVHPVTRSPPDTNFSFEDISYGQSLINEALKAQRSAYPPGQPSVKAVLTSFLLYGSYRSLNDQSKAWFFLREATTLYLSGLYDETMESDIKDSPASNQLFWVLLITERAYSIRKHRPLTLFISSSNPSVASPCDEVTSSGFEHLVSLFQPIDETFIGLWNETIPSSSCSAEWLLSLEERLHSSKIISPGVSDIQKANIVVSQQWLRVIVWQLSNNLGFLSSTSNHASLTFHYPIQIARDLVRYTWRLPHQSMDIHGIGLTEKLFDIAYTLIDVMALMRTPALQADPDGHSKDDCLVHLLSLIAKLRGGEDRFLPILISKIGQELPSMELPYSQNLRLPSVIASSASPPEAFRHVDTL